MTKVLERIRSRIPSFKKRMMEISFDISAQIYEYMKKENNMSQKEFAKRLNKKESEVSKWLSGGHNFTIETIAKIEEVFKQKILVVPMFASDDLGIKHSTPETVTVFVSPTIIAKESLSDRLKKKEDFFLNYSQLKFNINSSNTFN